MKIKAGVQLSGVHYMLFIAAAIYDHIRHAYSLGEGTITSGRDGGDFVGAARVAGTLHPVGRAIDLRTTDLPGGATGSTAQSIAATMGAALGSEFQVVIESDHIHVEYVPMTMV